MALVIGLIYDRDENWIAGSYYIENLIFALASLPGEKPLLKIYSTKRDYFEELRTNTRYVEMTFVQLIDQNSFIDKVINKVSYTLFKTHWVVRGIDSGVDLLFPGSDTFYFDKIRNKVFWIPDFQEKHYPAFFNEKERISRKTFQEKLVRKNWPVVFSSQHALGDFKAMYPLAKNRTFVMPFAVTIPSLEGIKIDTLKQKFGIHEKYFICSNQFWAHKNHIVILKALTELRKRGDHALVVFTGKPYDSRNPQYYDGLLSYVSENELQESVRFLGFVDRKEQLVLIENSIAVIQPSLFEGWSTVIEDAKALNVPIIASDIIVHREQIEGQFFDKEDPLQLAEIIIEVRNHGTLVAPVKYSAGIKKFGERFMDIVNQVISP